MGRLQYILAFACFASSLFSRAIDPLVPLIARDLETAPERVALLSTAFALPFGLLQLAFGPIGDRVGREVVIRICMVAMTIGGLASAFAWGFGTLFTLRVVCGAASAGIFPATIALIGDRVALDQRQAVLSKMLAATISGTLFGAIGAGLLVDLVDWRGVFLIYTATSAVAAAALFAVLPAKQPHTDKPAAGVIEGFRSVLRNPRAKVCFIAVFLEGLAVFGLLPFVALLLEARGEGGPAIAGLVIAGFPLGGILYAAVAPRLVASLGTAGMMAGGGIVAGLSLLAVAFGLPWQGDAIAFIVLGIGFYTLHNSMQVQATELSAIHRGSAVAMHGSSFMTGQALGPVIYGPGFTTIGVFATLATSALVIAMVGIACAILLGSRAEATSASA
ncbi:MFS transporter [Chelatococcus reniformis]|uniref:MFS transporter n=1 Tax=Chelatococcus reniformis TaxID=1494448 RepID=A0A916XG50_9HYPH|nr:MFS transporter [Chelatococcus reniformis]GGC69655.1 MFS transporter [Chelatococcus reniformis]